MTDPRPTTVGGQELATLGHIRSHGCRDLLIYCGSWRCYHSATMIADWLPDDTPVRSLCRRMVCTKCGMIGADVRISTVQIDRC
jgi:hypothetical protein